MFNIFIYSKTWTICCKINTHSYNRYKIIIPIKNINMIVFVVFTTFLFNLIPI